jgi:hypothetical protein
VAGAEIESIERSLAIDELSTVGSSTNAPTSGRLEDSRIAIPPDMAQEEPRQNLKRLFRLFASQKWFFLAGISIGLVAGATFPVVQWMWGNAVDSLRDEDVRPSINTWAMWFMIVGIIVLFVFL